MPKNRCFTAKKVYKVSIVSDKTPFSENTISVSEVNATIKACIDAPIFKGLEVFGEISGYKFSGAHAYFTLKDKTRSSHAFASTHKKRMSQKTAKASSCAARLTIMSRAADCLCRQAR